MVRGVLQQVKRVSSLAQEAAVGSSCLADTFPSDLVADIMEQSQKKQTGVNLKYILDFASQPMERQTIFSARFLQKELPIRLAHRVADLDALPYGLGQKSQVLKVRDWYVESFREMREFPLVTDAQTAAQFTYLMKRVYRRHANVVPVIAKGIEEFKKGLTASQPLDELPEIHQFLDRFFMTRIGIRFLIGHHIAIHEQSRNDHIGLIHTKCSPQQVAQDAVEDARAVCFREYGSAPQVVYHGPSELQLAYIPSHLHHMLFELVKNSLRAVQDRFDGSDEEPPPIHVVFAEGQEDITIKVSDQGGGIVRSGLPKIWTYLYTTARSPLPEVSADDTSLPVVLAGYGCGLPISRLYARYFGGDLQIISMDGYGTDAYLHLCKLGDGEEPLP